MMNQIPLAQVATGFFAAAGSIVAAILTFGFLVFVHELGHFIAAKKSNVKVNEFALGMGPKLISIKRGETAYSIRLLPVGGFVSMEGEDETSSDGRAFGKAKLRNRAIIMAAGALTNLLVGLLLMGIVTGVKLAEPGALIPTTQIHSFHESAVTDHWLQQEDIILAINGNRVHNYSELVADLVLDTDGIMDILVERQGEELLLQGVTFDFQEENGHNVLIMDFYIQGKPPTILSGMAFAWEQTGALIRQIWGTLIDLIFGRVGVNQLSGPVGITKEMSNLSRSGDWSTFFLFVAMLSLNLGVLNLLPFPVLDGGKLLLLLIEAIIGKSINQKLIIFLNVLGILLLVTLMAVVSFQDIRNLFI